MFIYSIKNIIILFSANLLNNNIRLVVSVCSFDGHNCTCVIMSMVKTVDQKVILQENVCCDSYTRGQYSFLKCAMFQNYDNSKM